ncbi:Spy/CpxP family protein refolding chaperone [uncultured Paraglaciecola sp.]|uniref:Spy/CpxP family protein refolding chaperone n=1 Tax=uncultured Paraglaciecola sp. TaxID=1765024 RepID=UPI00262223EF|nr:Spy/CpxP family protein refolding chaperone [uncultured Paraglaciecola sp.]
MSKIKVLFKTTLTPIALCVTLICSSPAVAKRSHHQMPAGMHHILSEVSLTDTQKQDVKQILKQTRDDNNLFKAEQKSLKLKLNQLVRTDQWDQQSVQNAIGQHQDLLQQKALQRAVIKNKIWNLLTAAQQSEFVAQAELRQTALRSKKNTLSKDKPTGKRAKRLDFTEQQLTAIQKVKSSTKASAKDSKFKLKSYNAAERKLIQSSEFNIQAWSELHAEYQADFLTLAILKAKSRHDVWNLLTPEQQQKSKQSANKKRKSKKRKMHRQQNA